MDERERKKRRKRTRLEGMRFDLMFWCVGVRTGVERVEQRWWCNVLVPVLMVFRERKGIQGRESSDESEQ
jgi:ABC-type cobalamin transport system permease subunit